MSNIYQRLANLNPKQQRGVATVITVSNGTTTVLHADGTQQLVLGDSVPSGKVYIVDGQVQGQAADLPYSEIEV